VAGTAQEESLVGSWYWVGVLQVDILRVGRCGFVACSLLDGGYLVLGEELGGNDSSSEASR
jgi:hypothetical protein